MDSTMQQVPQDDGPPLTVAGLGLDTTWGAPTHNGGDQNILYITVGYVKEDEFKIEEANLTPEQTANYTDFEDHVSPLDPNMSSVARYSPVYATESSAAYNNPVVVRQLVTDTQTDQPDENFVNNLSAPVVAMGPTDMQAVNSTRYLQMVSDQNVDIGETTTSTSRLSMMSDGKQEVELLITDQATGISYSVSTQEYLVERCLADDQQLLEALAPDPLLDTDLLSLDETTLKSQLSEIVIEPEEDILPQLEQEPPPEISSSTDIITDEHEVKTEIEDDEPFGLGSGDAVRRSTRQIKYEPTTDNEPQLLNCVETITDKPVPTRAKATCPDHLSISKQEGEYAVFAKKSIKKCTQFGPLEGKYVASNKFKPVGDCRLDLKVQNAAGEIYCLDLSDENTSNWMRFVRKAKNQNEQNLIVFQQGEHLYYMSTKNIFPKQELLVGYSYTYARSFNLKYVDKYSIADKPLSCPVCYKIFASQERMRRHMIIHTSEDSKPYKCGKCTKRFLSSSALTIHEKTHLMGRKVFECPICRQRFSAVAQLKAHTSEHLIDGKFTCPHCSKEFNKYSIIRKHIRVFHCEKKHYCPECTKSFPTLDKLKMHLLRHSDHREFLCADCGKQFKRKDKLNEHCRRMHTEERENAVPSPAKTPDSPQNKKFVPKVHPYDYLRFIYKCHTCMVGFKRRGMLVNHLAKRHPEVSPDTVPELNLPILRTQRDYFCQYCDKIYRSSSKRKAHILKFHPGAELPMSNRKLSNFNGDSSVLPNPTFSKTVGSVTTHPQSCQWCHKQYASKAKLLQHQRKKHPDILMTRGNSYYSEEKPMLVKMEEIEEKHNDLEYKKALKVNDLLDEMVDIEQERENGQFYHLVPVTSSSEASENGELFRLLTTENNMAPPR